MRIENHLCNTDKPPVYLCFDKISKSGFTLIELMIVVAIIGILAAVSIASYVKYITNTKHSEAKVNLDSIAKGAISYYSEEHAYDGGMSVFTRQYPAIDNPMRETTSTTTLIGGLPYEGSNWGGKHSPLDYKTALNQFPWTDLHFQIRSPFYYSYDYDGIAGSETRNESYFSASASACLNVECKSENECDSGYVIAGGPNGTVTPILDNSGFNIEKCGKAGLEATKQGLAKRGLQLDKL